MERRQIAGKIVFFNRPPCGSDRSDRPAEAEETAESTSSARQRASRERLRASSRDQAANSSSDRDADLRDRRATVSL